MAFYRDRLGIDLDGCGPEARFVFEVLAKWAAVDAADAFSSKVLAARLHQAEKLVSGALYELVQARAVMQEKRKPKGRGRPAVKYELSPHLLADIQNRPSSYGIHSDILERLFSNEDLVVLMPCSKPTNKGAREESARKGKQAPTGTRSRLTACNRLLLGALLVNADKFGVVRGVSRAELRRLTGFDTASLTHRLQRITDLGLIRRSVPGLSSSIFNGGKVTSTFFLNLNHASLAGGKCALLVHLAFDRDRYRFRHADVLLLDVKNSRHRDVVTPMSVTSFLSKQRPRVFNVIQVMLYRYASHLLSHHWNALAQSRGIDDDRVGEMIWEDFRAPERLSDRAEVDSHFCMLAFEIARDFRSRFSRTTEVMFADHDMTILPVAGDLGYSVITMIVAPVPAGISECIVFEEVAYGGLTVRLHEQEVDIALQNRYDFGLLTASRKGTPVNFKNSC